MNGCSSRYQVSSPQKIRLNLDLRHLTITTEEIAYLRRTCPYLNERYLLFLESFRFDPSTQVDLEEREGELHIQIHGLWCETILYEIPLLALVSEAYFRFVDQDWCHEGQWKQAREKALQLLQNGCLFSEFGTRRRRDYHTQDLVIQGLQDAAKTASGPGMLTGTSNVHFAMKYGLAPVGTVAHEWIMGIAAITEDYQNANCVALQTWVECFGEGVLGIALTDTFGTSSFLQAFETTPTDSERPLAEIYTGVRQDSGDPMIFLKTMQDFYTRCGISPGKTVIFSDALNLEKCIGYKQATEAAGLTPAFGIGTFFTNDFVRTSNGHHSEPLNIVIKLTSAAGRSAIKLSDDLGKNTGDARIVHKVKQDLGYVEKQWPGANEGHRW